MPTGTWYNTFAQGNRIGVLRMEPQDTERRLAAILAADVAGYTRLMHTDENATMSAWWSVRQEVIDPYIGEHGGRIVKHTGDGFLAEFGTVLDAVQCAAAIQREQAVRNADVPTDRRMDFRIGINLGDIVVDSEDIYGDGVNIAARIESLAEPGGISVSGSVYDQVRKKVDLTFEDMGEQTVKNISEPIHVYAIMLEQPARSVGTADKESLEMPDRPSIAVLPFDNMSGDPDQEYFSDGLSEDIITDLSKVSALFVIARNSVFNYKGRNVGVQKLSRELGVRYVVEGSVRKSGNRVRITAQLIDGMNGGHLWAERYDRNLTDVFALQDEITEKIVTALQVKLTEGEQKQVVRRYTENLEAYDHFLRGRAQVRATNVTNAQAREMFEKAIELDPRFAAAYAILSFCHWRDWFNQWNEDPQILERAFKAAKKSVMLDDSLPLAHAFLAQAYLWKRQHEKAIAEGRYAISLDPNFAEGYVRLGEILSLAGRPKEGVELVKKAMRLDPHFPPNYLIYLGHAYYAMGKYEDAIIAMKRSLTGNPDFLSPHRTLAVMFSELGRAEEAQAEVAEILRINPHATLESQRERIAFSDLSVSERYLQSLNKAGLPE
jgi:adenylate cyclase